MPLLILAYDNDIDSYTGAPHQGAAGYLISRCGDEFTAAAQKLVRLEAQRGPLGEAAAPAAAAAHESQTCDIRGRGRCASLGELVDASGAGCRIELKEELAVGDLVRIILHGHEDSTHVALGAEVRWHRVAPSGIPRGGGAVHRARRRSSPASSSGSPRPD